MTVFLNDPRSEYARRAALMTPAAPETNSALVSGYADGTMWGDRYDARRLMLLGGGTASLEKDIWMLGLLNIEH